MRSMERNKKTIYYALQGVSVPLLDSEGNDTGETTIGYGKPVKFKIRVSPTKGEAEENAFGKTLDYDRVLYTADKSFQIDEYSRLWIDSIPQLNLDGTLKLNASGQQVTPHDYKVVGISKDLNEWLFAVKKVI